MSNLPNTSADEQDNYTWKKRYFNCQIKQVPISSCRYQHHRHWAKSNSPNGEVSGLIPNFLENKTNSWVKFTPHFGRLKIYQNHSTSSFFVVVIPKHQLLVLFCRAGWWSFPHFNDISTRFTSTCHVFCRAPSSALLVQRPHRPQTRLGDKLLTQQVVDKKSGVLPAKHGDF